MLMPAPSVRRAFQTVLLAGTLVAGMTVATSLALVGQQPATAGGGGGAERPAQPAPPSPGDRGPGGPGVPGGTGGPGGRGPGQRGEAISIEGAMKQMNGAYKRLKSVVADPAKAEESLRFIGDMERGCVLAKNQSPKKQLEAVEGDAAKAKKAEDFRRRLIALNQHLLQIELALLDKKFDEAKKLLDGVEGMEEKGHEAFAVKE